MLNYPHVRNNPISRIILDPDRKSGVDLIGYLYRVMTDSYDYDLVVIGSGPAGEKGAAQAAYFGKKVALVEHAPARGWSGHQYRDGTAKTLRETALYFSGLRQRGLYGIDYSLKADLNIRSFMFREQAVVETEWKTILENLERHHITTFWGQAALKDAHRLQVKLTDGSERELSTNIILIASGSAPFHPPEVPFDHNGIYDRTRSSRWTAFPGAC